jgi:hypothetical protein
MLFEDVVPPFCTGFPVASIAEVICVSGGVVSTAGVAGGEEVEEPETGMEEVVEALPLTGVCCAIADLLKLCKDNELAINVAISSKIVVIFPSLRKIRSIIYPREGVL